MQWLDWGRFFGPLSGHQSKISDDAKRYILTTFAYGTGLGPAQVTAENNVTGVLSFMQFQLCDGGTQDMTRVAQR